MAGSNRKSWLVAAIVTLFNIAIHIHMQYSAETHLVQSLLKDRHADDRKSDRKVDLQVIQNSKCPPVEKEVKQQPDEERGEGQPYNSSNAVLPVCEQKPNLNRVYLLETEKDHVIPKVLCTMESLARHMHNWCIVLYVINYDESKASTEQGRILREYKNTRIIKLDPHKAVMDTPFEGMFKTHRFQKAGEKHLFYAHYSDILRVVLLYKYGGIYMDLDIIAMRSVDLAPQYLVRTGHGGIANGMMKFRKTSFLLLRYVTNIWTDYAPEHYSRLFYVLCETVEDHCKHMQTPIKGIDMKLGQIEECDGVTIFGYNSGAFAPFAAEVTRFTLFNHTHVEMFQKQLDDSKSAFIHYSGNARGNYNTGVNVKTDQTVFARVFRQNCPLCTKMFDHV